MLLKQITLYNFRNFKEVVFKFSPTLTIIFGENAKGKTNLLEAIFCLTAGEGFRETRENELVNFDKDIAQIDGEFDDHKVKKILQFKLAKSDQGLIKNFYVNRVKKKWIQYRQETIKAILFSPQQLEIVTGSPDSRRRYFDQIISYYDTTYKKRLINYDYALRKRNKILEVNQNEKKLIDELFFWDDYLEEQAKYIQNERKKYVDFLNKFPKLDSKKFLIEYLLNELTEAKLKSIFAKEKRYRRTLIGPQKDDYVIYTVDEGFKKNLHLFGSRSEHRLSIFWLELNEIRYYELRFGHKPILLLDDLFSELDMKNKKLVLGLIRNYQTVATTAEREVIDLINIKKTIISL